MSYNPEDILKLGAYGDDIVEGAAKYGDEALSYGQRLFNRVFRGTDAAEEAKAVQRAADKEALDAIGRGEGVKDQTAKGYVRSQRIARRADKASRKAESKALNPSAYRALPTWARRSIVAAPILGAIYGGTKYFGGGGTPTSDLDYSNWDLTPYGMPGKSTGSSVLDDYLNKQRAEVERYYNSIDTTVPGAEIYDPMSAISTQLGAASSKAMSDLANQYANTAASIKQGGVQGAASINDIYGAGAANMADVASQAGGQYGGMIPVAGAEALAPGQQIAAGQDLANYLAQNQLISAQTQGGMAELAQMLGPAYANQYALIDAQMRAQATAQKALKEAELRQALEMEKAGALADITRKGIEQGYQDSLYNQDLAEAIQQLATPKTINQYAAEYEDLEDRDKAFYAKNYGIDSPEAYVRFQLTSLAKQYGTQ